MNNHLISLAKIKSSHDRSANRKKTERERDRQTEKRERG